MPAGSRNVRACRDPRFGVSQICESSGSGSAWAAVRIGAGDPGWLFAYLAGASPLRAASGKIARHRLNRFGDRQLNRALHVIINWRMLHHDATRAYLTRRRAEQKTDPEIHRCLKRYAARQLFRLMEHPQGT
jgi:hypothetical protein